MWPPDNSYILELNIFYTVSVGQKYEWLVPTYKNMQLQKSSVLLPCKKSNTSK